MPRVEDFAISVVDLFLASDKSNPSGVHLGCIDFTGAFRALTSQFASRKRVTWLSRSTASGTPTESSRLALPPVPICWAPFQQFSHVWVSQCSSPRSSESKRVWTTLRGSFKDRLSAGVFYRSCSCASGQPWGEPVLEERQVCRLDMHHDHRPPTPRFQCSVDRSPLAQSRRTPGPHGKTLGRLRSFTCHCSPRLRRWPLPVARDSLLSSLDRHHETP